MRELQVDLEDQELLDIKDYLVHVDLEAKMEEQVLQEQWD